MAQRADLTQSNARRGRLPVPHPVARPAAVAALLLRSAFQLPILYKVLVANATIVMLGAVGGTWLTVAVTRSDAGERIPRLIVIFAVLGLVLSLIVNYAVLVAAFRPLRSLEQVAAAVRMGNLSARANPSQLGDPRLEHLAETFNGTLDELERDRAELRSVASRIISAQEDERKRISRELHDDTAQVLFAQLLRLTALKASPSPEVRATAAALEEMTVEALEGVRRLALELRPPALDDLGLHAALDELAQRFGEQLLIPIDIQQRGARGRLPAEVELVLYRVAQEALTNIAKHAAARHVWLDVERGTGDVTLAVRDDGRGFDPAAETRRDGRGLGLGLFGMAERVSLVDGRFVIWSRPGAGTELFAFIPLAESLHAGGGERG